MKKIFSLFTISLFLHSCSNTKESHNIEEDKAHRKANAFADTTAAIHKYLSGLDAETWSYSHSKDWCGSDSKVYRLCDGYGDEILSAGIVNGYLISTKREFDKNGKLSREYKLFSKSDNYFIGTGSVYQNDSILLRTIIPLIKNKWASVRDSLNKLN
jgi:hypothetical protein